MTGSTKIRISVFLTAVMLLCAMPAISYAAPGSTQEQLNQAEQDKKDIKDKLEENQENLDNLKDKKKGLQSQLNGLNDNLQTVSDRLSELEGQIDAKNEEIEKTGRDLEEARRIERQQYESMKQRIRFLYEKGETSVFDLLIVAHSISDFVNYNDYVNKVAEYDRNQLREYQATRNRVAEQEMRLKQEKEDLEALKVEAEAEKSKIAGLISKTSNGVAAYADQISDAEADALEYEAQMKQKEQDIKYLKQKLAEELAMSQQAANAAKRDISEVTFADGDRALLANLIYCEAGGESYAGQLAVGAVVINRVLSSVYPDTVVGVIYQSRQFSPVASGRLALALAENRATAGCYQAADEAMSGVTNVGGCVYFRTPVEGLTGISIGGHIFY